MSSKKSPKFVLLLAFFQFFLVNSQQLYQGKPTEECLISNNKSVLGYTCNGHGHGNGATASSSSCQAFLTFHSQPPYQTPYTISTLLGSDLNQLSLLNSVSADGTFPTNTKIIVPINCSCSNGYYHFNSTYTVQDGDNSFVIANRTFQGLSTCQAIQSQNQKNTNFLDVAGTRIIVPLRCACPTQNQTRNGVKYLLSYLVDSGDIIFSIAKRFGVSQQSVLDANDLPVDRPIIFPFTTILVPLENQPNSSQVSIYPDTPSPSFSSSSNYTLLHVGIGVGVAGVMLIAIGAIFWVLFTSRKRRDDRVLTHFNDLETNGNENTKPRINYKELIGYALKVYDFEELELATRNFSSEFRIEGSVYRGVFDKNEFAAVKKMKGDVSTELEILKKISHFNLIKLIGVCFNEDQWYLVYEYARNGCLSKWISNKTPSMVLTWIQRVQIALDVANGLNYLHSFADPPYVHKDINSSNILLDSNFRAKIANFTAARAVQEGDDGEFVLTRHIFGTQGYMAPEYIEHGLISPKLDVYGYGVVLMELLTGKNAISLQKGDLLILHGLVCDNEDEVRERIKSSMDPSLEDNYPMDLCIAIFRVAEGCLRKELGNRLGMGEIAHSLSMIYDASAARLHQESTTMSFQSSLFEVSSFETNKFHSR